MRAPPLAALTCKTPPLILADICAPPTPAIDIDKLREPPDNDNDAASNHAPVMLPARKSETLTVTGGEGKTTKNTLAVACIVCESVARKNTVDVTGVGIKVVTSTRSPNPTLSMPVMRVAVIVASSASIYVVTIPVVTTEVTDATGLV